MKTQVNRAFFNLVALGCLLGALALAQQPSTNTNVLPGSSDPVTGDYNRQRQTEPTVAASTLRPDTLFSAFIDYRTVTNQGDPSASTHSEAWLGCSRSFDRGRTWFGCMVPGFPNDTTAVGMASPLYGLSAGGDPVLASGTNGWFHLGGLFFDRGGYSTVAVARYRDEPALDGGDTIRYKGAFVVDRGSASDHGNFTDKPAIVADVPRNLLPGQDPLSACGPVYFAYTIFNGNSGTRFNTKVGFSRSIDCGATWSNIQYVNKSYSQNQGTAMAVDPNTGKIYLVWRHVQDGKKPHSILMVTSVDQGVTFTSPVEIGTINPFDQPALSNPPAFRANAFPTIAVDASGRIYVAIQERTTADPGNPVDPLTGQRVISPRIVIRASTDGGKTFPARQVVEDAPNAHQVFPHLSFAAGQLMLMWKDFRSTNNLTDARGNLICPACSPGEPLSLVQNSVSGLWEGWISGYARQMNPRVARATVYDWGGTGNVPFGSSVQISQYLIDANTGQVPVVPCTEALGKQAVDCGATDQKERPAVSWANLKMYVGGTRPFIGDYNWLVSGAPFVRENGKWRWATLPGDYAAMARHAVWYDNRDVVFPVRKTDGTLDFTDHLTNDSGWQTYSGPSGGACANFGSRDGNVYYAEVRPGVVVSSAALSRQLINLDTGQPVQRALPMYVENPNPCNKFFTLTIQNTLGVVTGSFESAGPVKDTIQVEILPYSTFTTNVYINCPVCDASRPTRPLTVIVTETSGGPYCDQKNPKACAGPCGNNNFAGSITFNADPTSPAVLNSGLGAADAHGAAVKFLQFSNLQFSNAQWSNAQWSNAQFSNAQFSNAQYSNLQYSNAQFSNLQYSNAQFSNNQPVGDFVWEATNTGNNTTSFASLIAQADPDSVCPGCQYEIIVSRVYQPPADCTAQRSQDQIISLIQNAQFSNAQFSNAQFSNAQWSNAQWSNAQYSNASFASSPEPDSATSKLGIRAAAAFSMLPDGTAGVPRAPDKVYIVLRVYAPKNQSPFGTGRYSCSGDTCPPSVQEFLGQVVQLVYPQATGAVASDKGFTTTAVNADSNCVAGAPCAVSVQVSKNDPANQSELTGKVKVTVEGESANCVITLNNGVGSCDLSLPSAGTKNLTATYLGNLSFNPSKGTTQLRLKWPTQITITTGPASVPVGEAYTVTWSVVTTVSGGPVVDEGTVAITDGTNSCSAAVTAGQCTLTLTKVGSVTLTASYSGSDNFGPSSTTKSGDVKVVYRFTGFYSPLTLTTAQYPFFTDSGTRNLSSGLPIKWSLRDASGTYISDLGTLNLLQALGCDGTASVLLYSPTTGAKGGSVFKFSVDQFVFTWDTATGTPGGCYLIKADFSDGSSYATRVQLQ